MTTYLMRDAATFDSTMLDGAEAIAGYIGGPNAYRTWQDSEWEAVGHLPKLPIWVPKLQASQAEARDQDLAALLNIIQHYDMPRGQVIAFDLETSKADDAYMQEIAAYLEFWGYGTIAYGSLSTINGAYPSYLLKWDADWTGTAHLTDGFQATQWQDARLWDNSEISQELYDRLLWR